MHLRTKLTLLYTGVLGLALFILTTVLLLATSHTLYKEVDESIFAKAASLVKSIRVTGNPFSLREVVLPDVDVFAAPDTYLQIVDTRGRVVSRSGNLGGQYLPLGEYTLQNALQGEGFYETVQAGGQQIRVYNVPLVIDGQLVGLLQVGRALSTVHALLNQLRFFIALVGTASILLAALLGWLLARTALRPLDKITGIAASIESNSDLGRRIEYAGPADELGRLVATLNAMFERLESMYHRLQQSYDLQRRFVSDASHELRTPLTTIRGNAELLLKMQDADPVLVSEALNDITDEARRLSRLVEDLLILARADAGFMPEKEPAGLMELLQGVVRKARFLAGDREFVFEEQYPSGAWLLANRDHFSQLMFILLDNAFKYSPPGSTVGLTVNLLPQGPVVLGSGIKSGYSDHTRRHPEQFATSNIQQGWVEIAVTDQGPGLAPGEENRIFDRFFRGESTRGQEGSGLGLSIARWIVDWHGGHISAANRPEGGSVFTVLLPLYFGEKDERSSHPGD
ncbi:HAMP domain-containing sensor histidine kinase [Desulfallas thermosapovorans]|uniref:histidine kinase n=1 Tax=Desulfallas thermosapovorans DSM 6562 TaxID=1121431 RepID=A0A5S4ZTR7_9FIRM|nr:HAMP domain-containing sensor histidine kinase [Desulfallas thermosapovorans]TYO96159.1 signal transduction histidine kinase [Desulfallas thermosapovorans DSM 6562]